MKELEEAKKIYKSVKSPPKMQKIIDSSFKNAKFKKWNLKKITLSTAASICILFVALLNCNSAFAKSVSTIPVISDLANVFTFKQYSEEDSTKHMRVEQPKVENIGNAELEKQINKEINQKVEAATKEAQKEAEENKKAYIQTGGNPNDYVPMAIDVNYEIKSKNEKVLSFVLNTTWTQANAFTEQTFYNIDLKTGKEITLSDKLGKDYKKVADESVKKQIEERKAQDKDQIFFEDDAGFQEITENQKFYINNNGNVVIVFAKYEIAPGCMGMQEFEIK